MCYPLSVFQLPVGREEPSAARDLATTESRLGDQRIETISGPDLLDLDIPPPEMLIEHLWQAEGCGYFAGEPKCLKTFTIFDAAISIVSGQAVFQRYQVLKPGPVVLFLEETKLGEAKQRLERLTRGRGLTGYSVQDLHLAVQQGIRLDREEEWDDVRRLCDRIGPRMVFFDPLARMHLGSENSQEEMGPILTRLRRLQVEFETAVALTHHLSKPHAESSAVVRTGHRIRGSGDQYAWEDCALYFTRARGRALVQIEVEHREAPAPEPFSIELQVGDAGADPAFRLAAYKSGEKMAPSSDLTLRILAAVAAVPGGMKTRELHDGVKGKGTAIGGVVDALVRTGRLIVHEERRADSKGIMRDCKILYVPEHAPDTSKAS